MSLLLESEFDDPPLLDDPYGSDDPFAAAIRCTRMAMVVADCRLDDLPIVFVNDGFLKLTGYERHEVLGRNCRFLQGPDTDRNTVRQLGDAIAAGREATVDLLNYRRDGTPFWNRLFISPVRSPAGEVLYFFGSQFDITDQKREELALRQANWSLQHAVDARSEVLRDTVEQKTVLLHEVEHRVKNNLQLVSSLIQFQARGETDPAVRAALQQVQERVSALATVHRRLFQCHDAGCFDVAPFLGDLADDALGRRRAYHLAIEVDAEPAEAPAAKAAPLALMLNEMIAHTLKHGFPDERPGRLRIVSRRCDGGLSIELSDDGALTAEEARAALGDRSSIADILRRQLLAEVVWSDNGPGVRASIRLPVDA
jgi:PAS domain S-box-containing protein